MWDLLKEGDNLRKQALLCALQRRNLEFIPSLINRAQLLHANDRVRLAELELVKGRIDYADKQYPEAIDKSIRTNLMLLTCGETRGQLVADNQYYWLKACIMQNFDQQLASLLIRKLLVNPHTSWRRRCVILIIEAFGRPACRFIDWLTYTDGNRFMTWLSRIGPVP